MQINKAIYISFNPHSKIYPYKFIDFIRLELLVFFRIFVTNVYFMFNGFP